MNIIDLIKEQHREFEELMEQVARTSADLPERERLFKHIHSRLYSHGRAEERVLFPRMEEDERTRAAALEAREWHHASSSVMKEIVRLEPTDERWLPKWLVVWGIIHAHLDAEERRALERAREAFSPEELDSLGRAFVEAEEAALAERPR